MQYFCGGFLYVYLLFLYSLLQSQSALNKEIQKPMLGLMLLWNFLFTLAFKYLFDTFKI